MRNRRARLVLTLLLLAAFTLITLDYRSGAGNGLRRAASTVFGPIEGVVNDVVHPIGSFFSSLGHLNSYKHENQQLRSRVQDLQGQLRLTQREQNEYAQDQKLLHLAGLAQFRIVAAKVIAYGGALGFESTVTINRGSANGIAANETVITGDGLVGRVVTVGRNTSTVLLANDSKFFAGARLSANVPSIGSVAGGGRGQPMTLTLFDNTVKMTVNERLVTFGDSPTGPFVPEVPIGRITAITPANGQLGETATVQPFVDFGSLDIVAVVVRGPRTIKHGSLLPASPTPAPTVTVTVTATPGSTPTGGSSNSSTTSTSPSSSSTSPSP
jgi:rod shape-determining protein MreC